MGLLNNVPALLALSAVVRMGMVLWGEVQDRHFDVKYTDVDYQVFTDAARFAAEGGSPYARATYRYSPLLAYLLVPNITWHMLWGKALFATADMIAALLMWRLLHAQGVAPRAISTALLAWLYNPFTFTISTRGSCDALVVVMLLGLLALLARGRVAAAGAVYGLAVHFRIYPAVFSPAIGLYLLQRSARLLQMKRQGPGARGHREKMQRQGSQQQLEAEQDAGSEHYFDASEAGGGAPAAGSSGGSGAGEALTQARPVSWLRLLLRRQLSLWEALGLLWPPLVFGVMAAGVFVGLGALFYRMYGMQFLQEAFLYHSSRQDPRHNFSPYYYPIYLSMSPPRHLASVAQRQAHACDAAASEAAFTYGEASAAARALRATASVVAAAATHVPPVASLALVPQGVAMVGLAATFHEELPAALLLMTWAFVALNKVVTAQYFVWYFSLLPLVLPRLLQQRRVPLDWLATAGVLWVVGQLHWLAWAYQLELKGASVHLGLWAAGMAFVAANVVAICMLVVALAPPKQKRAAAPARGDGGRSSRGGWLWWRLRRGGSSNSSPSHIPSGEEGPSPGSVYRTFLDCSLGQPGALEQQQQDATAAADGAALPRVRAAAAAEQRQGGGRVWGARPKLG